MDAQSRELFDRIQRYVFDTPGTRRTFESRLAEENGWTTGFARRVVEEYRRFALLSVVAGHTVAPSDEVDQAWHLHLTCSHTYWKAFCQEVLGQPLHHWPSKGGRDEHTRHLAMYEQTLASYRRVFGEAAPADIWPPAEVRFDAGHKFQRVDTAHYFLVPRSVLRRMSVAAIGVGAVAVSAAAAGPLIAAGLNPLDLPGPPFLALYAILAAIALVAAIWLRRFYRDRSDDMDVQRQADELSPLDVACLQGGPRLALYAAMASLVHSGALRVVSKRKPGKFMGMKTAGAEAQYFETAGPLPAGASPLERALYGAAGTEGQTVAELRNAAAAETEPIVADLKRRNLVVPDDRVGATRWMPFIPLALVLLLGVAKIVVGLDRVKPVAFLVIMSIGFAIVSLFFLRKPFRTRWGDQATAKRTASGQKLKESMNTSMAGLSASDVALGVGLFGVAALATSPHTDLHAALKQNVGQGGAGGSGCGTGCGGGGCGGGGGGCGGGGCGGCGGGGD